MAAFPETGGVVQQSKTHCNTPENIIIASSSPREDARALRYVMIIIIIYFVVRAWVRERVNKIGNTRGQHFTVNSRSSSFSPCAHHARIMIIGIRIILRTVTPSRAIRMRSSRRYSTRGHVISDVGFTAGAEGDTVRGLNQIDAPVAAVV